MPTKRKKRKPNISKKRTNDDSFPHQKYVLEKGSLQDILTHKSEMRRRINYCWSEYVELAFQRESKKDKIFQSLRSKAIKNYSFTNWQRLVKFKYSLHPLSCVGSMEYIGGRFNYGNNINGNLTAFPTLYLAQDKDTAFQEVLMKGLISQLDGPELALTNPDSITIISISGILETIFDLRNSKYLSAFVKIIKDFKFSPELKTKSKKYGLKLGKMLKTSKELWESLNQKDWRKTPNLFDIPSNNQIFGHTVNEAGICGILYKSHFTGRDCLAIFPDNFKNTESFVSLDDDAPSEVRSF